MAKAAAKKLSTAPTRSRRVTTADAEDVARFSRMAETWWDATGPFKPLHALNPVRMAFIRDHAAAQHGRDPLQSRPLRGLKVLDIGCGGGLLCEPLCRLGATVTGIDASQENIAIARSHAQAMGLTIDYRAALPEVLADEGLQFDLVVSMEVIEHVADVDGFVGAAAALTHPAGGVALATLNRTLKSLAMAKIAAEYLLRWLPVGTHDWRKFVRPSELAAGLRRTGLSVVDLKGVTYQPFNDDWVLSDDLDVNYMAFAVKDREPAAL